jgi:hypothetical protein
MRRSAGQFGSAITNWRGTGFLRSRRTCQVQIAESSLGQGAWSFRDTSAEGRGACLLIKKPVRNVRARVRWRNSNPATLRSRDDRRRTQAAEWGPEALLS